MTPSSTTSTRRRDAQATLDRLGTAHRAQLLESAVEILDSAAGGDDADLALTCRGVLDALRRHHRCTALDPRSGPLPAPGWASRSVHEDGRIVYETVNPIHPTITTDDRGHLQPTDISLSATDEPAYGNWVRTKPTIQVEGGSYPLASARQLRAALDDLLRLCEQSGAGH